MTSSNDLFNRPPINADKEKPLPKLERTLHARTVWISDIHLGYRDCKAQYLLDFLDHVRCDTLYLVGDVIDFWALKKRFCWPAKHYEVMLKLYALAEQGVRVIYVPGNHDDPIRRFSGELFGPIEVALEHEYVAADGRRWLVMHGDAMDAYINLTWITKFCGNLAYSLLLLINRWTNRFRKLMGRPYFSLAGLIKSNIRGARTAVETYQNEAIEEARRRGYDGVICGHIHCPALFEANGIGYANTGDWIESCTALLEDDQGQMQLLHYADELRWHTAAELDPEATAEAA